MFGFGFVFVQEFVIGRLVCGFFSSGLFCTSGFRSSSVSSLCFGIVHTSGFCPSSIGTSGFRFRIISARIVGSSGFFTGHATELRQKIAELLYLWHR